jgi:hypothetical protein
LVHWSGKWPPDLKDIDTARRNMRVLEGAPMEMTQALQLIG